MRQWKLAVMAVSMLGLSLVVAAQKDKPVVMDDRFEKAHDGLFSAQQDKGVQAGRFTAAVADALPQAATTGKIARKNFIDDHIFGRIEKDHIPHAPLASDEEFIRRAYIDATGLLPSPQVVREFLANSDPQKREALVDSLIGTDAFADQWAWFWGDLFRTQDQSYHQWTKEWLKADRPYNDVFYDLVTATAKGYNIPVMGFYHGDGYDSLRAPSPTDPDSYHLMNRLDFVDAVTVNLGRIFLGTTFDCISCHDGAGHLETINLYLSEKTRADFHKQAAFLGKLRRVATYSDRALNVSDGDSIMDDLGAGYKTSNDAPFTTMADNRFPRDGRTYEPEFILTGEKPAAGQNPREELARILPSHIQFSRAAANLIWGRLMTVGFVEPYDSFDLARLDPKNPPPKPWSIQPTNPELLNALAEDFKGHNFSIQHLIRTVMKSNAYNLSAYFEGEWKDAYVPYYARHYVRVLTGPEAADLVAQATGVDYQFSLKGQRVSRLKQLSGPGDIKNGTRQGGGEASAVGALMQAFFQSTRETPASLGNKASAVQAMLMMASPIVNKRVAASPGSRLALLLESEKSDVKLIEELFLAALSRLPAPEELTVALGKMQPDRARGVENIQWALINSAEFLLNH